MSFTGVQLKYPLLGNLPPWCVLTKKRYKQLNLFQLVWLLMMSQGLRRKSSEDGLPIERRF